MPVHDSAAAASFTIDGDLMVGQRVIGSESGVKLDYPS